MKIAVTGGFRRGKDTVAGIIARQIASIDGRNVVKLAFADALKTEVSDMTFNYLLPSELVTRHTGGGLITKPGARRDWDAHMRRMRSINGPAWQWWGEYRRQTEGEDYWIHHPDLQSMYQQAERDGDHVIITDMRHHNEAAWCRRNGFFTLRVEGPCRADESRDPNHPSEIHIRELVVHAVLHNGGTMNDLTKDVLNLLRLSVEPYFSNLSEQ